MICVFSIDSGIISNTTIPTITPPAKLRILLIILFPLLFSKTPKIPPIPVPTTPATKESIIISVFIFLSQIHYLLIMQSGSTFLQTRTTSSIT